MKLLSGPSLGVSGVIIIWFKWGSYLVQVCFLAYFIVVSSEFAAHSVIILCFFLCPIIWQICKKLPFFQKKGRTFFFSNFSVEIQFLKIIFLMLAKAL